jgi:hypothetical protein
MLEAKEESRRSKSISKKDGNFLTKLARDSLEYYLKTGEKLRSPKVPPQLKEKSGVFVTISTKQGDLRGCTGIPNPVEPLVKGVIDSAIDAGINDSRFRPVKSRELGNLNFEVTVLTKPEPITSKSYPELLEKIHLGKDGLMIKSDGHSGLFLPQVPEEFGWNKEQYYTELCEKAGIPLKQGEDLQRTKVFKFQGKIFEE